jgi:hypothetical protein
MYSQSSSSSHSQGRERGGGKRPREDFGPLGSGSIANSRQEFLSRERFDSIPQKRVRSSWGGNSGGGRADWDDEPGQIPDRQMADRQLVDRMPDRMLERMPDRERDLRDIEWDRGLGTRGRLVGRDDSPYFNGGGNSNSSSSGMRDRGGDDHDHSSHRWPSSMGREG